MIRFLLGSATEVKMFVADVWIPGRELLRKRYNLVLVCIEKRQL